MLYNMNQPFFARTYNLKINKIYKFYHNPEEHYIFSFQVVRIYFSFCIVEHIIIIITILDIVRRMASSYFHPCSLRILNLAGNIKQIHVNRQLQ